MGPANGLHTRLGEAEVAHLARFHQVLDGAGNLFDGHGWIDAMLIEQVDMIGAQAAQTPLDGGTDIQLDDRLGNWVTDRVDVGFRLGNPPQEGLIARHLFPLQLIICASSAYLRKHGVPRSLHELARHRCSAFRRSQDGHIAPWRVQVGESVQEQLVTPAFSTNDEEVELRAALAGSIMGQFAGSTVAPHIRAGRLVPLLLDHVSDSLSFYLYYGSRTAQPARVRRFIELCIERLGENWDHLLSLEELEVAQAQGLAALE